MAKIPYNKPKTLKPSTKLAGTYNVLRKLDGVRVFAKTKDWLDKNNCESVPDEEYSFISRAGKVYKGLSRANWLTDEDYQQAIKLKDFEFFHLDWNTSVGLARSHDTQGLTASMAYGLTESTIGWAKITELTNPTYKEVEDLMYGAMADLKYNREHDGIILASKTSDKLFKVKTKESADLLVIGYQEGTGKYTGMMGALITKLGKVGTGFTDLDRCKWSMMHKAGQALGKLIEVEYEEFTKAGVMKMPRYTRIREDKDTESY